MISLVLICAVKTAARAVELGDRIGSSMREEMEWLLNSLWMQLQALTLQGADVVLPMFVLGGMKMLVRLNVG